LTDDPQIVQLAIWLSVRPSPQFRDVICLSGRSRFTVTGGAFGSLLRHLWKHNSDLPPDARGRRTGRMDSIAVELRCSIDGLVFQFHDVSEAASHRH
jgi:hypothetical protein